MKNIEFVNCGDNHIGNKDANLIDKVIAACDSGISNDFMFWSDDQVMLREHEIKPVTNNRSPRRMIPTCKWEYRLKNTGVFIYEKFGQDLLFNFDSHVPQPMNRDNFKRLSAVNYQDGIGFCICTLYYGINGFSSYDRQIDVKATFESKDFNKNELFGKNWLGFNTSGYMRGTRKWLMENFKQKSRYEK